MVEADGSSQRYGAEKDGMDLVGSELWRSTRSFAVSKVPSPLCATESGRARVGVGVGVGTHRLVRVAAMRPACKTRGAATAAAPPARLCGPAVAEINAADSRYSCCT